MERDILSERREVENYPVKEDLGGHTHSIQEAEPSKDRKQTCPANFHQSSKKDK